MRIIVCGGEFANKGGEAMLRTTQAELGKRLTGVEFFLWRLPKEEHELARDCGLTPVCLPFQKDFILRWPRARKVRQFLWSLAEVTRSADCKQVALLTNPRRLFDRACADYVERATEGFDALVDVSGFAYGDSWGVGGFRRVQPVADFCRRHGKPVVFLPQAWGSFDDPAVRVAIRGLLDNRGVKYYSRDSRSSTYIEQLMEKPDGSVPVSPDIAFAFEGGTPEQGVQSLRNMGCSMNRPIVGVSPNCRVYERAQGEGGKNVYIQALVRLVRRCLSGADVDVVLQANEIACAQGPMDDRYLCGLIAALVNRPDRCFTTREPLTAESTKALIGRFEFLISSRFHSSVFAFSQGIPGMAVSWSHKYRELFSLFGMEESVRECREIDADALIATFERGWGARRQSKPRILERAGQLRAEVDRLFDDVAAWIRGERAERYA
jgi:polysaccharide pyruvyl transferase WcaK-like protein